MNKNADISKYKYFGYCIGFDRKEAFSHPSGGFCNNVIVFGIDMSSSIQVDNKKNDILILGKDPAQGLDGTASLTSVKFFSINFGATKTRFCLSFAL